MLCKGIYRDNELVNGPYFGWVCYHHHYDYYRFCFYLNLIFFIVSEQIRFGLPHMFTFINISTWIWVSSFCIVHLSKKHDQKKIGFDKWANWFSMPQSDCEKSKQTLWLLIGSLSLFLYPVPPKTIKWKYASNDLQTLRQ